MSLYALLSDWEDQLHRSVFYMFFVIFCLLIIKYMMNVSPNSPYLINLARFEFMFTVMFPLTFLMFTLFYPKSGTTMPVYTEVFSLLSVLLACGVTGFTNIAIERIHFDDIDNILVREYGMIFYIFVGIGIGSFIYGLVNLILKYMVAKTKIIRLNLIYFFIGLLLGSMLQLGMLSYAELIKSFEFTSIGLSFSAIFFVSMVFYASMSSFVMDFPYMLSRIAMYSIMMGIVFAPIFAILYLYYNKAWPLAELPVHFIAMLIISLFILINMFILPKLIALFNVKIKRFESKIDKFLDEAGRTSSAEYIIQKTADTLYDGLFLHNIMFLWFIDKTRKYELLYYRNIDTTKAVVLAPIDRAAVLIRWFVLNHGILSMEGIYSGGERLDPVKDELIGFYESNDIEIILPIFHERMLYGLLCLGPKAKDLSYSEKEMELINMFHQKSNDIISTIFFYEKAMKEQFVTRTKELSDDILKKTTPANLPYHRGMRFGSFIIPRYDEGGDYFDFKPFGNSGIGVLATDISGIGLNSAIYSVILRSAFQSCIAETPMTYLVMQILNKVLYDYGKGGGSLVTSYYFYYDFDNMRLFYSNAGFPALEIFRVARSDFDTLDTEGIPLGFDGSATYGTGRTNMNKEDIGVLFSKSLINSKREDGGEFGLVRLRNIIRESRGRRPNEISDSIYRSFRAFMGTTSLQSDVFLLIFKIY